MHLRDDKSIIQTNTKNDKGEHLCHTRKRDAWTGRVARRKQSEPIASSQIWDLGLLYAGTKVGPE